MGQVIAAAISVLILVGAGLIWFKLRKPAADQGGVVAAVIRDQEEIKVSIDKALIEKNEQERRELDAKVEEIRKGGDLSAALELLAKLRGVH